MGTVLNIAPDRFRDIVDSVGNVWTARQFLLGGDEILRVAMAAIERNKVTRRLHARAIDPTGVDRVPQCQLPVTEIVFAGIAQGGESLG